MTELLIGVDVGNSKTHVAVATTAGRVLAVAEAPGGSPDQIGAAGTWALVQGLAGDTGAVVAGAFAVAGLDFVEQETAFAAAAPAPFDPDRSGWPRVVCNDTFAVLRAADARDGIAVVVGAGMNCVGRLDERTVRFPALGAVSGDWGGGAMIAEAAVGAAARAADGRGPATALTDVVPERLGLADVDEVLRSLANGAVPRSVLVGLARPVLALADAGDAVCATLARRQADEVVDLVRAAVDRLAPVPDGLVVALGGGVLRAGCRVLDERVHGRLAELRRRLRPTLVTAPPVAGALLLAADLVGAHLDAAALGPQVETGVSARG